MHALSVADLLSLEEYHKVRPEFREKVLAHKKNRQVAIGPNATLYFEDRLTIQYQIQEMLRIERIFESEAIEDELSAYNPLIPSGMNFKATFMIEFPDIEERRRKLSELAGIEDSVFAEVEGFDRVYAIADEDMDRATESKTSAVHFVRFELDGEMIAALKRGAELAFGCDHKAYDHRTTVEDAVRSALVADLD
jgi:hypothetical protein